MNIVRSVESISNPYMTKGTRSIFTKSVFLLILLLPVFVPSEISSAFYGALSIIALITAGLKIKRGLIELVSPFLFLLSLGILGAFRHPLFDVMKDVWYLAKVVFALGAGYYLMQHLRSLHLICRLVVVAAIIAAMFHLLHVLFVIQDSSSIMDMRNQVGGDYFVTTFGLGLLVGIRHARRLIGFNKWPYYFSIMLCTGSLIASGSRTDIISFTLMVIILRGWWGLNFKSLLKLAALGSVLSFVFISGSLDGNQDEVSLLAKFSRSTTEVAISNYEDINDINLNWRGFESYRAYLTYLDGSIFEKLFGQGFGELVDLGFYMPLAGSEYRYIPVLHNGYMYVLVKYGLLGILAYLYFMFKLIRIGLKVSAQQPFDLILARRLISSLGWIFLFSTIVVSGVFNKSVFDSSLIILGATVAWFNMHNGRKTFSSIHSSTKKSSMLG